MKDDRINALSRIRPLAVTLLLCVLSLVPVSCGDEGPDYLVGYYMSIQSQVRLSLYDDDESQGTSSDTDVDVLSTTIRRMRAALKEAYPQNTLQGDDAGVLTAIDEIYRKYKASYADKEGNTVCTVKLYRTKMDGTVVKESTTLTTYHFGALPDDSGNIE